MHIAFITVGDPQRLTGGYLYHREVFRRLRAQGFVIEEIVASAAELAAQLAAAELFGRSFNPLHYDLIVVDALARAVVAPWLDSWRAQRPLLAMVHELPSVANDDTAEQQREAGLLRANTLIAVSQDGATILERRGVSRERIRIVAPGFDRFISGDMKHRPRFGRKSTPERILLPAKEGRQPSPSNVFEARRVLCVAQWIARKDIVGLVEAWSARRVRT
ncbi:glycosyltransferase, partial [Candidatus Gracilibacteria bacterium]|nr:glycosyltransferase [Candidatus Gracilibacteria bacterium]